MYKIHLCITLYYKTVIWNICICVCMNENIHKLFVFVVFMLVYRIIRLRLVNTTNILCKYKLPPHLINKFVKYSYFYIH